MRVRQAVSVGLHIQMEAGVMAKKEAPALVPEEEQPYPVPENWCWVNVGALIDLYRGVSYKKNDAHSERLDGDYLIMRGGNILEGAINTDADNVYVNRRLVQEEQVVKKYDIIIVSSTGSSKVIGRAGISHNDYNDVAFGAFLLLARPNKLAVKPFVNFFFQSELYRDRIRLLANGVNINNIRTDHITSMPIPFPPISEQHRIVARIESLFAKLDEAKEKLQAVVDGYEIRRAAILHRAFSGELTAKWRKEHSVGMESWKYLKIGDFAEVKGGKRLPKGHKLVTERTMHPYLRIVDFGAYTIDTSDLRYITDDTFEQISRYVVRKGDVYLSIVGSIGKAGTIPDELDGANLTENAARIISKQTVPEFLSMFLSSPMAQDDIKKRIRSATLGKLSLLNVKDMQVPLPLLAEQIEITRILRRFFALEDLAFTSAQASLAQIDLIKKSILARAFCGKLGTNDPEEARAEFPAVQGTI